jgi:hypothetical protein
MLLYQGSSSCCMLWGCRTRERYSSGSRKGRRVKRQIKTQKTFWSSYWEVMVMSMTSVGMLGMASQLAGAPYQQQQQQ